MKKKFPFKNKNFNKIYVKIMKKNNKLRKIKNKKKLKNKKLYKKKI